MNKLKLMLALLLSVGFASQVKAEVSSEAYTNPGRYYDQQVFVSAYNNTPANTFNRDNVVILDIGSSTAGSTMGAYVMTTQVTDSIFVFGVTDESCAPGRMCRICVKGPHKVVSYTSDASQTASGAIISSSTIPGQFGQYSRSDGTAGGQLGYVLSGTATTDTGDASNTYWAWIEPRRHK